MPVSAPHDRLPAKEKPMPDLITQASLKEILHYDPDTGLFTRRVRRGKRWQPGTIAGTLSHGYIWVSLDGRKYAAQRLAFLYITGHWPPHDSDHRNGIRDDNRWRNLRAATRSQNNANSGPSIRSKSGLKGVVRVDKRRWKTYCGRDYIGSFRSPEEAARAYDKEAVVRWGEYARTNF